MYAQEGKSAQTIRGIAADTASGHSMPFVSVALQNTTTGTFTAEDGTFAINDVPIGKSTSTPFSRV
ncbi:MAG: carboxypeptidase-like regulatory domain-containing protein [Cytophagaceae bacterium]|jgi:hypothetical protein|nr:carboxypeptidase-like regulatory domain-containing protein [Cytophagaceae bacterium]